MFRVTPVIRATQLKSRAYGNIKLITKSPFNKYAGTGGAALIAAGDGLVTIRSKSLLREFRLSLLLRSGELQLQAYDGEVLVDTAVAMAASGKQTVFVRADRFDKVLIQVPARAVIYSMCWLEVDRKSVV